MKRKENKSRTENEKIDKKLQKDEEDWDLGTRQCGVNDKEDCESCQ